MLLGQDQNLEGLLYGLHQQPPVEGQLKTELEQSKNALFDDRSMSSFPAGSLFSVATRASVGTMNTQYSDTEIASATQELVEILCNDKALQALYQDAVECPSIGVKRFTRNFRRLLQQYSRDLKEDAAESLEYTAAGLVSWKAREVAQKIADMQDSTKGLSNRQKSRPAIQDGAESSDSEEEQPRNLQEDSLTTLTPVREFLADGVAFQNLKTNLEKFIKRSEKAVQQTRKTMAENNDTQLDSVQPGEQEEQAIPLDAAILLPQDTRGTLRDFFARVGFVEPHLEPGKERIRWKCVSQPQLLRNYTTDICIALW